MKVTSNVRPVSAFEVESIRNGYCDILFYENVLEIEKEDSALYEYDMYRMKTPYREELYTIIESDVSSWISRAKEIENDIMKNPFISDFERVNIVYNQMIVNAEEVLKLIDINKEQDEIALDNAYRIAMLEIGGI